MRPYRSGSERLSVIFLIFAVVMVAALLAYPSQAFAQTPKGKLSLPDVSVNTGSNVVINVTYTHGGVGTINPTSYDLVINWNPLVASFVSVTQGPLLFGWNTPQINSSVPGQLVIAQNTLGAGLNANGVLLQITLHGLQLATDSPLTLSRGWLDGIPSGVIRENGTLDVTSPPNIGVVVVDEPDSQPIRLNSGVSIFPVEADVNGASVSPALHNVEFDIPLPACLSLVPGSGAYNGTQNLLFALNQLGTSSDHYVKVILSQPLPGETPTAPIAIGNRLVSFNLQTSSGCMLPNQSYTFTPVMKACSYSPWPNPPTNAIELNCSATPGTYQVDYNLPPSAPSLSPTTGSPGAPYAGGSLSTVSGDPNSGDTLSFSLVPSCAGTFDNTGFSLSGANSSVLAHIGLPLIGSVTACIQVSDGRGGATTGTVSISVSNSPPVISGPATASIAENNAGWFIDLAATDPNGDTLSNFAIVACASPDLPASPTLSINSAGRITGSGAFNFEAPGLTNPFHICAQVTDPSGDVSNVQQIAVTVTNVNEAPVISGPATASIAENSAGWFIDLAATDPDGQTLSNFAIVACASPDLPASPTLSINSAGRITGSGAFNFEAPGLTNPFHICAQVTDPSLAVSNVQQIVVTVTNVNEAPVISGPATASFAENNAGWFIDLSATDPDGQTLSNFSIVACASPDLPASPTLSISSAGRITGSGAFNFETLTTNPFHICAQVTDPSLAVSNVQQIEVTVTPVNETPAVTSVVINSGAAVVENAPLWTVQVNASDPDASTTLAYSLEDAELCASTLPPLHSGVTLSIDANGLASGSALDYEMLNGPSFDLCVKVTDGAFSVYEKVTISPENDLDEDYGDCNFNDKINATDLQATILEYWDDSINQSWLLSPFDAHRGSPEGCNSNHLAAPLNPSLKVDAADVQCTVNLIFAEICGADAAAASPATSGNPALRIPLLAGETSIPVTFAANGHKVSALGFTIKLGDEVALDPSDANQDGIPDAISFRTPAGLQRWAQYNAEKRTIQIMIADATLSGTTIDGEIATITITGNSAAPGAAFLIEASAGTPGGLGIPMDLFIGQTQQFWTPYYLPSVYIR